jgi:hypothetical protein
MTARFKREKLMRNRRKVSDIRLKPAIPEIADQVLEPHEEKQIAVQHSY